MTQTDKTTEITLNALAELAVDCWRFNRWLSLRGGDDSLVVPRHVLRRLTSFLEESAITTVDMVGQPFDPGLAVDVIDTIDDQTLLQEAVVICETISPIIMWDNVAIRHAQVVVRQNQSQSVLVNSEEKQ